ncbi:MAG: acyl-CoA synthetase FdrA [Chloroflexi bacterium]|nr:acyl-CoA synthetase FdrA [Chloroflexota bacterium]
MVQARVFRNSYRDSVELMRIAAEIEALGGITRAGLVMATPANREVLQEAGLLAEAALDAGPNDLVVAVAADGEAAAEIALGRAAERLSGADGGTTADAVRTSWRTIAEGIADLGGADVALISTPGTYATAEALKALKRGINVFLFSDNVPIEDEIELKNLAVARDLLLMGPDCGTAILDGVPLGFANAVRRGGIGLIGASGTGLQQVSCLIDRAGAGISQAIGVGGRDLDDRVGGTMMLAALRRLDADPGTRVIVLISKPPGAAVARLVVEMAGSLTTPVVVNFLGGDPAVVREFGLIPARTFEAAANAAAALSLGEPIPDETDADAKADATADAKADVTADAGPHAASAEAIARLQPGQWRIRGLFAGGSLSGEAKLMLGWALGAEAARTHEILDLGDDEYTVGRPHPMIDPRLRNEHIAAAADDPSTAVILLDVVLGYGANADPAGALVPAIRDARQRATQAGRHLVVVASVCGTDADLQGRSSQEAILAAAGVILARSNAQAAGIAAAIAAATGHAGSGRAIGGASDGAGSAGTTATSIGTGPGATL